MLELVARLAEQGLAVVLISHNLHDIFAVADRITVLRLGRSIGVYERSKTTQQEVVEAITAGVPTKVSGIPGTGPRPRGASSTTRWSRRRRRSTRPGSPRTRGGCMDNLRSGNLGSWPVIVALALIVAIFG